MCTHRRTQAKIRHLQFEIVHFLLFKHGEEEKGVWYEGVPRCASGGGLRPWHLALTVGHGRVCAEVPDF